MMTVSTWPFKSAEDLKRAGYRTRGYILCPECGESIVIYQQLDKMPVFLDPETFKPHLWPAHTDPPAPPMDRKTASTGEKE